MPSAGGAAVRFANALNQEEITMPVLQTGGAFGPDKIVDHGKPTTRSKLLEDVV